MELCLGLSLSFCAVIFIVLLRQCYVAMLSGFITRALWLHGIYCRAYTPSCFSGIYVPYIPRARVITITQNLNYLEPEYLASYRQFSLKMGVF